MGTQQLCDTRQALLRIPPHHHNGWNGTSPRCSFSLQQEQNATLWKAMGSTKAFGRFFTQFVRGMTAPYRNKSDMQCSTCTTIPTSPERASELFPQHRVARLPFRIDGCRPVECCIDKVGALGYVWLHQCMQRGDSFCEFKYARCWCMHTSWRADPGLTVESK